MHRRSVDSKLSTKRCTGWLKKRRKCKDGNSFHAPPHIFLTGVHPNYEFSTQISLPQTQGQVAVTNNPHSLHPTWSICYSSCPVPFLGFISQILSLDSYPVFLTVQLSHLTWKKMNRNDKTQRQPHFVLREMAHLNEAEGPTNCIFLESNLAIASAEPQP